MYRLPPNEKKMLINPDDEPDLYRISDLFPLPSHAAIADSVAISHTNEVCEVAQRATFPTNTRTKVYTHPNPLQHHDVEQRQSLTGSKTENLLDLSFLQQQEQNLVLQQQHLQQLQELQLLLQTNAAHINPPQGPAALLFRDEATSSSSHAPFDNNQSIDSLPMMVLQQQQFQMEQIKQLDLLRQQEQQLTLNLPAGMSAHDDLQLPQRQTQQQILLLNQAMSEPSVMMTPPWNFDGNFQTAPTLQENPQGFLHPQDRVAQPLMNSMLNAAEFLAQLQANNETKELQER